MYQGSNGFKKKKKKHGTLLVASVCTARWNDGMVIRERGWTVSIPVKREAPAARVGHELERQSECIVLEGRRKYRRIELFLSTYAQFHFGRSPGMFVAPVGTSDENLTVGTNINPNKTFCSLQKKKFLMIFFVFCPLRFCHNFATEMCRSVFMKSSAICFWLAVMNVFTVISLILVVGVQVPGI